MKALIILSLFISFLSAADVPELTKPLLPKWGPQKVSVDYLLAEMSYSRSLDWLDCSHFLYSLKENIYIFSLEEKTSQFIGKGYQPKASPNGEWIAFFDRKGETYQLAIMKKDGSEREILSFFQEELKGILFADFGFAWSPDSKQIAVYLNPLYEDWNPSAKPPQNKIILIDLSSKKITNLFFDTSRLFNLSWYPDGAKLLFFKVNYGNRASDDISSVHTLSMKDGKVATLTQFNGRQQFLTPIISPQENTVAILYNAENPVFNWMLSLGIISADSEYQSPKQLTFDIKLNDAIWSNDDHHLYFIRCYGPYSQIYSLNIKTYETHQITYSASQKKSLQLSPDGMHLLWLGIDGQNTYTVQMISLEDLIIQDLIAEPIKNVSSCEVREIEWETIDYPAKMRGLLYLPLNYHEGNSYPLVVDVHGGGEGASIYLEGNILQTSPLEWQLWASKGYAVFVPEYRSSGAFGFLAIKRDKFERNEMIDWDTKDIIAGVDELVKQGVVDNNRVALIGHSAGGRRVNWMSVSSDRFKVVISKEGWVDEFHRPEEPAQGFNSSPLVHVDKAKTPVLFLMGNPDLGGLGCYGTPVFELYKALKARGIKTEYVEYCDEGHVFEIQKNRRGALEKAIEWIDHYIGNYTQTTSKFRKLTRRNPECEPGSKPGVEAAQQELR